MTLSTVISILMPALLGGGLITALATLYKTRRTVPVERDSIIVTGAQGAVLSLETALRHETARADRAERESERLRAEKEHLLAKIEEMQAKITALQDDLGDLRRSVCDDEFQGR